MLSAQESDYISKLGSAFQAHHHHSDYTSYLLDAGNPVEFIFAGLFVSYKAVLSSQDMNSCVFTPSCSVYGIESIKQNGLILGVINTFDRLTRCHPFAGKNYKFDEEQNRLYDPVN